MNRAWRVSDLPAWIRPNVTVDETSGCFRVAAGNGIRIDRDGYARAGIVAIHRLVYMELVDDIPDGLVIDHVKARGCARRDCSRPDHMEPVTVRENIMRGDSFVVANYLKTHCSTCGAEYDLLNTYVYPDGRRDCRNCRAAASERYAKRQRDKRLAVLADAALSLAA